MPVGMCCYCCACRHACAAAAHLSVAVARSAAAPASACMDARAVAGVAQQGSAAAVAVLPDARPTRGSSCEEAAHTRHRPGPAAGALSGGAAGCGRVCKRRRMEADPGARARAVQVLPALLVHVVELGLLQQQLQPGSVTHRQLPDYYGLDCCSSR